MKVRLNLSVRPVAQPSRRRVPVPSWCDDDAGGERPPSLAGGNTCATTSKRHCQRSPTSFPGPHAAFSLVELLTVIAIIAVLASLLMTAVVSANKKSRTMVSTFNLRQISLALNLYLDDDISKGALAARLKKAGHSVVLPPSAGLSGVSDPRHLLYAVQHGFVVLSKNHDDFEDLHLLILATQGRHPGILIVRGDNDPTKDMKDQDIVRAIRKVERAGVPIINAFHIRIVGQAAQSCIDRSTLIGRPQFVLRLLTDECCCGRFGCRSAILPDRPHTSPVAMTRGCPSLRVRQRLVI